MFHTVRWLGVCALLFACSVAQAQENEISATVYQTVNVRSSPGARSEIVGQISEGDTVMVDGREREDGGWLHVVLADGAAGWVPGYALILEADPSSLPVMSDGDSETGDAPGAAVMVRAYGRVNVRTGPGIGYDIIDQLDVNDEAQAFARSTPENDWLYIERDDLHGWVAYFTVEVRGDPRSLPVRVPDPTGETLIAPSMLLTTRFNTRLREEAALDSPTIEVIPFDTEITPLAKTEDGEWLYIAHDEILGWASSDLFGLSPEQLETLPLYSPGVQYIVGEEGIITVEATPEVTPEGGLSMTTPEATPAPDAGNE